ncbi:MAG: biotin transporter BioY, partial [Thermoprotei archaeon]
MRARELTLASLMSIVTGLSAQLCIYIGPIPYTLQNFGVVLSGLLLTPKYAMLAQSIYLWLIAVGAPLGAGFKGGVNVFLGPTAGYLMAFPIAAYLTSIFSRPLLKEGNRIKAWLVCTLTTSVIYILGITWLYFWLERFNGDIMMWM